MRYVNGLLCVIMVLFAAVQYNDPDAVLWIVIYLIPAFWCGLAAYRAAALASARVMAALGLCVAGALVVTIYYWPDVPGWWREEVWWQVETAREGMGVMIATVTLIIVLATGLGARAGHAGPPTTAGSASRSPH